MVDIPIIIIIIVITPWGSHKYYNPRIRKMKQFSELTIVPLCNRCNVKKWKMIADIKLPYNLTECQVPQ